MSEQHAAKFRLPSFEELTMGVKPDPEQAEQLYTRSNPTQMGTAREGKVSLPTFETLVSTLPKEPEKPAEPDAELLPEEEEALTPEQLLEQADQQAQRILAVANEQAAQILLQAQQQAKQVVAQGQEQAQKEREQVYAQEIEKARKDGTLEIARVTGLLQNAITAYAQERDSIFAHIERRLTETTLAVMRLTFKHQLKETPQAYGWLIAAAMDELGQSKPTVLRLSAGAYTAVMTDPACRGIRTMLQNMDAPFELDKSLAEGEIVADVDEGSMLYGVDTILRKLEDKLTERASAEAKA